MNGQVRALSLAGLLAGCAAPQNHYYVLSPSTTGEAAAASPDLSQPTVTVSLPALLDRLEIVEGTGPHTVRIEEFDRWAAPLDEMVPRVLAEDLAAAEAGSRLADKRRIAIHIDDFMAGTDGVVHLSGTWSVLPEQGTRPVRRTWRFSLQTSTDPQRMSAVAESMSRLLDRLAAAIATTAGPGQP